MEWCLKKLFQYFVNLDFNLKCRNIFYYLFIYLFICLFIYL